jgi:hypothetical protein
MRRQQPGEKTPAGALICDEQYNPMRGYLSRRRVWTQIVLVLPTSPHRLKLPTSPLRRKLGRLRRPGLRRAQSSRCPREEFVSRMTQAPRIRLPALDSMGPVAVKPSLRGRLVRRSSGFMLKAGLASEARSTRPAKAEGREISPAPKPPPFAD